jgi:hypothetical protein
MLEDIILSLYRSLVCALRPHNLARLALAGAIETFDVGPSLERGVWLDHALVVNGWSHQIPPHEDGGWPATAHRMLYLDSNARSSRDVSRE